MEEPACDSPGASAAVGASVFSPEKKTKCTRGWSSLGGIGKQGYRSLLLFDSPLGAAQLQELEETGLQEEMKSIPESETGSQSSTCLFQKWLWI